ncbi:MAG: hypothetical protein Q9161_009263 [Pseudevernia consocians]
MRTSPLKTLGGFVLVLRGYAQAQITLAPIPTDACAGKGLSGSATFASSTSLATGAQRIPAGDFWNQVGAEWVFDTDTSGVLFSDLAANNGPDTPAIDKNAVSLDDSSTRWTFSAASGVYVKDSASGSNLVIQRYLAYNAFINLSNFFEVMISQLLTASNNGLGISTTISTVGECILDEYHI